MRYDIYKGVRKIKTKFDLTKSLMGLVALALPAVLFLSTGGALAASTAYELFGDAQIVSPGNASPHAAQIRSTCPGGNPACLVNSTFTFGGVRFDQDPAILFDDLGTLSTDYNFTEASCGGGAPRFVLRIDSDGNGTANGSIAVYIGPSPSYTGCTPGWQNTGNFIGNMDAGRWDATFMGGPLGNYATTAAFLGPNATVMRVTLVTDGAWSQAPGFVQTVQLDNVNIDGAIQTFDQPVNKEECKNGGWMLDSKYKNQGDCVSFFATKGKNQPANL